MGSEMPIVAVCPVPASGVVAGSRSIGVRIIGIASIIRRFPMRQVM